MGLFDRFKRKKNGAGQGDRKASPQPPVQDPVGEIINACSEYCGGDEEKFFLLCLGRKGTDWFYQIRGRIVARDEMNSAGNKKHDLSPADRQKCLERLQAAWKGIAAQLRQAGKPEPAGMMLSYDNRSHVVRREYINDPDMNLKEAVENWIKNEQQELDAAGEQPVYDWAEAYIARQNLYRNKVDNAIIGCYTLSEGVETILPVHPAANVDGEEVTKWVLTLFSLTENNVVANLDYDDAIKALPRITGTQVVDHLMYVDKLTLDQQKQLASMCREGFA